MTNQATCGTDGSGSTLALEPSLAYPHGGSHTIGLAPISAGPDVPAADDPADESIGGPFTFGESTLTSGQQAVYCPGHGFAYRATVTEVEPDRIYYLAVFTAGSNMDSGSSYSIRSRAWHSEIHSPAQFLERATAGYLGPTVRAAVEAGGDLNDILDRLQPVRAAANRPVNAGRPAPGRDPAAAAYEVDETQYMIEYTIKRIRPGENDWTKIGFGSSGAKRDIDAAEHALGTHVEHYQWQTSGDMPDPDEVRTEIQAARAGR